VVEGNGGRIWVQSEGTGAGSNFFVEFPVSWEKNRARTRDVCARPGSKQ